MKCVKIYGVASLFSFFLISCQPSSEELFEAGIVALDEQDFDTAIGHLNRLVENDTSHAPAWNARG